MPTTGFGVNALEDFVNDKLTGTKQDFPDQSKLSGYVDNLTDKSLQDYVKGVNTQKGIYNDPTYLTYTIMFDWYESPLFKGGLSNNDVDFSIGNDNVDSDVAKGNYPPNSALGYFSKMGLNANLTRLRKFIQKLNYINYHMPWYWDAVNGLDTAYKKYEGFRQTPFRGGADSIITINTLESIDMLIYGMMDLYRKAVDDNTYRREILPDNLRKFDVYIYVSEMRMLQLSKKINSTSKTTTVDGQEITQQDDLKTNLPKIIFKFKGCKFINTENSAIFETVNDNEIATNAISFKYDDVEMTTEVPWFDFSISTTNDLTPAQTKDKTTSTLRERLRDKIESEGKEIERKAKLSLKNLAVDSVRRLLLSNIKLPFTNVYGKSYEALQILQTGNVQSLVNSNANAVRQYLNNVFGNDAGNLLATGLEPIDSNPDFNITTGFPTDTPSYIPMRLSNIYED